MMEKSNTNTDWRSQTHDNQHEQTNHTENTDNSMSKGQADGWVATDVEEINRITKEVEKKGEMKNKRNIIKQSQFIM